MGWDAYCKYCKEWMPLDSYQSGKCSSCGGPGPFYGAAGNEDELEAGGIFFRYCESKRSNPKEVNGT